MNCTKRSAVSRWYPCEIRCSINCSRVTFTFGGNMPYRLGMMRSSGLRFVRFLDTCSYRRAPGRSRTRKTRLEGERVVLYTTGAWCPRQDSNLHLSVRTGPSYPLDHGGLVTGWASCAAHPPRYVKQTSLLQCRAWSLSPGRPKPSQAFPRRWQGSTRCTSAHHDRTPTFAA